ncbi:MAG TPA: TonB-dependent receptor [Gemmatimonadaceae bacterium]|nr:TonB-dependent receptor [Gemmatimonadaceae bacterium]
MRIPLFRRLVFAAQIALPFAVGAAQQAKQPDRAKVAATYSVAGTVADQDGNAVPDAEVSVLEHDTRARHVRSDSAGRFQFSGLVSNPAVLSVRHFGFAPRELSVTIPDATHRASIVVTLDPSAAEIDGMSVTGQADRDDERLRAFNERRATNSFGKYIDEERIRQRRPQFISELLREVPGVSAFPGRLGNTVRIRGCAPLVWLDGVRLPGAQIDDVARPPDIAGIEIYSSFAGIPSQYFDRSATCGTILVWTKAK